MQKWEQKQRQKAHQLRVENAKASVKNYSGSKQRGSTSSRAKKTPGGKNHASPISKILEIFQLQKYGPLLASYGFPNKLTQRKSLQYLDQMLAQVAQKDKERFLSLLNTLTLISKDVKKQVTTPQSASKSASKNRKVHYPPPPSTSIHNKQSPTSVQKSQKTTIKFRIKEKSPINPTLISKGNTYKDLNMQKTQQNSRNSYKTRQNSISTDRRMKKCTSYMHSKASDDLSLIHDFGLGNINSTGILRPVAESNKVIQKLMQKLQSLAPSNKKSEEKLQVNLQIQKIKQMYLSFDSATLTSNIINIDVHQMIECFAMEVKQLIAEGQVKMLARSNVDKIKSLLHESFILEKKQSNKSKKWVQEQNLLQKQPQIKQKEKQYKHSLEHLDSMQITQQQYLKDPSINKFDQLREIDYYDENNNNIQQQYDTDRSSIQEDIENCSIDLGGTNGMKQSSIWGNSYIASVINDFSCFDYTLESKLTSSIIFQPQYEDIKNFIELVVMSGRMEKQVPIIAYIYLNRLLNVGTVKEAKITNKNWKNLILITLIQASKIWDDQSLQNHSFAKLIKPYTTLEINRLEKYLVYFLDYRLTIEQKEYSQAYFKLRGHIGQKKSTQTANMLRLDLKTIRKLQQAGQYGNGNTKKVNNIDKNEFYKKLMNKSF